MLCYVKKRLSELTTEREDGQAISHADSIIFVEI